MEAVHVLFRGQGVKDRPGVQTLRQGKLNQNAVHGFVLVQLLHQSQQVPLGNLRREAVGPGVDAAFRAVPLLAPDIDLRGGVLSRQHHRQHGRAGQGGGLLPNLHLDFGGQGRAVKFDCHPGLLPWSPFPRRGERPL